MTENIYKTVKESFYRSFYSNLVASICYETLKTLHIICLYATLDTQFLGVIGSFSSLIYFSCKLADAGTTYTLPSVFREAKTNKQSFIHIIIKGLLGIQAPFVLCTIIGAPLWYYTQFNHQSSLPVLMTIAVLIFLETFRSFFRYLLNFVFKTRQIVRYELASFCIYLIFFWAIYFSLVRTPGISWARSIFYLSIPHIIDSCAIVCIFLSMIYKVYNDLPVEEKCLKKERIFTKNLIFARMTNYIIRVNRDIFTVKFFTPLFAVKFGLAKAGFFFLISSVVSSLDAVIKMISSHSGAALFANLKNASVIHKQKAFATLCSKVFSIAIPAIVLFAVNAHTIFVKTIQQNATNAAFVFTILMAIHLLGFFVAIYEQFYFTEQFALCTVFTIKVIECLTIFIALRFPHSLNTTMLAFLCVRIFSFLLVAFDSYLRWGLIPSISETVYSIINAVAVVIGISFFVRIIIALW